MSIHKLTAGPGYDYLTRQVAAFDATEKGRASLASYYSERGESPGVWVGSGLTGIDGVSAGDLVTAEQMQALFGSGHHPLAHARRENLQGPDLTEEDYRAVTRLGLPYKVYASDVSSYRVQVAKRLTDLNVRAGLPSDWPVRAEDRAVVRTEVAREFFRAEFGRDPRDARELAGTIARKSRPKTQAVAGFDLTFSPVKSVSTLWALVDQPTAARIEQAHQAAVQDALRFLEDHALYSREGANGVRQVDVRGLVATAFTHRDSRTGDPDLHTHVAVANKVQTLDGKWLAIDGRVLFKATVAASETYNSALERHLHTNLGVRFKERVNTDQRRRVIREVVGIDPVLTERWSTRRATIEDRRTTLSTQFQRAHGRPPSPIEAIQLAQQATLETREAKHEPRSLAEQRTLWRKQADEVLDGDVGIESMLQAAIGPTPPPSAKHARIDVENMARAVITQMEHRRSTWQVWHVRAETERQVRHIGASNEHLPQLVDRVVDRAVALSVSLKRPEGIAEPRPLRRVDGSSVYTVAGADLYTSAQVVAAERRLVTAAGRSDGRRIDGSTATVALLDYAAHGIRLNSGQAALVHDLTTSGARLQLAIAPAGSGKTTAMHALTRAWCAGGGQVLGLAPSAAAASVLREQTNAHTDTLAKLVHEIGKRGPATRTWLDVPLVDQETARAAGAAWDPRARSWYAPDGSDDVAPGARLHPWRVTVTDIGPETLAVIDEAGMADTLSLDLAVRFVLDRGGSVRLIGDDQQLAAIGAGGVLRDIHATHGACRLTELVRFIDPAEGAASLALRQGQPEALGFYLDQQRVHVGDLATTTHDVFSAWQRDYDKGLDSIMLAPTRELVSELNRRAQTHRRPGANDNDGTDRAPAARLADGNSAQAGDLVITRSNDRRLRTTATDWVKNGDRWNVLSADANALRVRHIENGRVVVLPAHYVRSSVELGYATTVHSAQGVSADTLYGLATGQESRQQLYTMLTRGRQANHLYLQVMGDGDPHAAIRPEMTHPLTPTDLLEQILARDEAPRSATTLIRDLNGLTTLLAQAAERYLDALQVAAEQQLGPAQIKSLEIDAEQIVPGLTEQPAWPALRAHLILASADGTDPIAQLRNAAHSRELDSASDVAAVLDWRLDDSGLRNGGPGPLPWMPALPRSLATHDTWGPYLAQRAATVVHLANAVRDEAVQIGTPRWATSASGWPADELVGEIAVWRAAMQVDDTDRRPTGRLQLQKAAALWQRNLDSWLIGNRGPAIAEWGELIAAASPGIGRDPFTSVLADRLAAIAGSGINAAHLLRLASEAGALPDDYPAAALWWRVSRHLSPAVAEHSDHDRRIQAPWTTRLPELIDPARAEQIQQSPWWPTLVTVVDRALQRGWTLEGIFRPESIQPAHPGDDPSQSLAWRVSVAMDPVPDDEDDPHLSEPESMPNDSPQCSKLIEHYPKHALEVLRESAPLPDGDDDRSIEEPTLYDQWLMTQLRRDAAEPLAISEGQLSRAADHQMRFAQSPVTTDRIAQINTLTLAFYRQQLPNSWAAQHLIDRFGNDLTGDERVKPGFAPPGWDRLVDHLHGLGVSDEEMLAAGVAKRSHLTGHIRDHFVNRLVLPIVHRRNGWKNFEARPFSGPDVVLGFVGRRNPDLTDGDKQGPKYLDSPTTALYAKGSQLYVVGTYLYDAAARPVLVEGPMDAIAVTLASAGRLVGVASLGTSLTEEHAQQLAALRDHLHTRTSLARGFYTEHFNPWLIVATDHDINLSGQIAAERDYWLLAPHDLDPGQATLPSGLDPADVFTVRGPAALLHTLTRRAPLAHALLKERLTLLPRDQALSATAKVLAARPAQHWENDAAVLATHLGLSTASVHRAVVDAAESWVAHPRATSRAAVRDSNNLWALIQSEARRATPHPRVDSPISPMSTSARAHEHCAPKWGPSRSSGPHR